MHAFLGLALLRYVDLALTARGRVLPDLARRGPR